MKNKWTSVKDKIPDDCRDVLICCETSRKVKYVDIGFYEESHKKWFPDACKNLTNCEVTHWMELPKLPKGD